MTLSKKAGHILLKAGANLAFKSNNDMENLKRAINNNTYIGAHAESGGHILRDVYPMCDYDCMSVINVLKHSHLDNNYKPTSEKVNFAKEKWLY